MAKKKVTEEVLEVKEVKEVPEVLKAPIRSLEDVPAETADFPAGGERPMSASVRFDDENIIVFDYDSSTEDMTVSNPVKNLKSEFVLGSGGGGGNDLANPFVTIKLINNIPMPSGDFVVTPAIFGLSVEDNKLTDSVLIAQYDGGESERTFISTYYYVSPTDAYYRIDLSSSTGFNSDNLNSDDLVNCILDTETFEITINDPSMPASLTITLMDTPK